MKTTVLPQSKLQKSIIRDSLTRVPGLQYSYSSFHKSFTQKQTVFLGKETANEAADISFIYSYYFCHIANAGVLEQ